MGTESQLALRLETPVAGDLAGAEMGVLEGGAAFLSARGVAHLCGVAVSAILDASDEVKAGETGGRAKALSDGLRLVGVDPREVYTDIVHQGRPTRAFTDKAVTAFLSYYAHTSRTPSQLAQQRLALLATKGLRTLVYTALGLDTRVVEQSGYSERLLLNTFPDGYFAVFTEGAAFMLKAEQSGLKISHETVPDISVGQAWAKWWVDSNLDKKHGSRVRHPHIYPAGYPQAQANGYIEPWIYPEGAIPEFRKWMRDHYIPQQFPKYLQGKVDKKQLAAPAAEKLLKAMLPKRLPKP